MNDKNRIKMKKRSKKRTLPFLRILLIIAITMHILYHQPCDLCRYNCYAWTSQSNIGLDRLLRLRNHGHRHGHVGVGAQTGAGARAGAFPLFPIALNKAKTIVPAIVTPTSTPTSTEKSKMTTRRRKLFQFNHHPDVIDEEDGEHSGENNDNDKKKSNDQVLGSDTPSTSTCTSTSITRSISTSTDTSQSTQKQYEYKYEAPKFSKSFLEHMENVKQQGGINANDEGVDCDGEPSMDPSRMVQDNGLDSEYLDDYR